jgi:hypothetical protein
MGGWANATSRCCRAVTARRIIGSRRGRDDYTCTKHTLQECLLELPCSTLKRERNGEIAPSGVKIRLAGSLEQGEINQRDFNRAAEEKCGKPLQ